MQVLHVFCSSSALVQHHTASVCTYTNTVYYWTLSRFTHIFSSHFLSLCTPICHYNAQQQQLGSSASARGSSSGSPERRSSIHSAATADAGGSAAERIEYLNDYAQGDSSGSGSGGVRFDAAGLMQQQPTTTANSSVSGENRPSARYFSTTTVTIIT
jgi:hypothetical protein